MYDGVKLTPSKSDDSWSPSEIHDVDRNKPIAVHVKMKHADSLCVKPVNVNKIIWLLSWWFSLLFTHMHFDSDCFPTISQLGDGSTFVRFYYNFLWCFLSIDTKICNYIYLLKLHLSEFLNSKCKVTTRKIEPWTTMQVNNSRILLYYWNIYKFYLELCRLVAG